MRYEVYRKEFDTQYLGTYSSYGIRLKSESGVIVGIDDISTDKEQLHGIAELLNKHEVSPVNFREIIEDILFS